ncbi:MAG: bifunctional [glutamine synthetase] adenylyltransferase/[glutamine synthetase]-adenylyl-L-tyrosine phosphorylase [Rhodospirillales bacterium]|nr:bifunctional [glutamine synthetase] adenylyltransferase/[glutamine synthetase]-adenylyl-L-tyrosine phosphorylase [Rhodospirillales bacterium]
MSEFYQNLSTNQLPKAANAELASLGRSHWLDALESADLDVTNFGTKLISDEQGTQLLDAIFGNSPFLTHCATSDPAFMCLIAQKGPDEALNFVYKELTEKLKNSEDLDQVSKRLRIAKRQIALLTAIADISNHWPLLKITGTLSDFASEALDIAIRLLLRQMEKRGAIKLPNPEKPEIGSGLVVLGMGKLGARELNYSSDIDIIVLFDDEIIETDVPYELQTAFVRLTRNLVKLIDERTADGYVFRTDLRLRPDPRSTPLALSVNAAEVYYESIGQNWERAAMIKARPIAGDIEAGQGFLDRLKPFIWRKNLDFAAIQDIHSIKRQINANRGGTEIAVAGHNLKLGRGGIREIEFYAQTQQLIWGGRNRQLRGIMTCDSLAALAEEGRITPEAAKEMTESYYFLRRGEHRLQMTNDAQTHSLPEDATGMEEISIFLGYAGTEKFTKDLLFHLKRVEGHYEVLFEDAPSLSAGGEVNGNLVFTGGEPDPETLKTLENLGFKNAKSVDETIRAWHHGHYRSTRSDRTRQMLTELKPTLLLALSKMVDPDTAFNKFDEFLSKLPSGLQLFSMFHSNPILLNLVAELMGGAPRLANHLSRHPALMESVLTSDFFAPLPEASFLTKELGVELDHARDQQEILEVSRRWTNDRKFQIGVQFLKGVVNAKEASHAYSNVAEAALAALQPHIEAEFAKKHGVIPGGGMAVMAMGKLGSQEMTPSSDLDLVYVYNCPEDSLESDGEKPLMVTQYFARLSQRFINAITAPMGDGTLYEVDMRLRPSGNAGPIASKMESFVKYHAESAWTWEHMALTRARMITGPKEIRKKAEQVTRDVLVRERNHNTLLKDVAEMRERMDKEHHADFIWDVKHYRGGLVDIEFLVQYLLLKHAPENPEILVQDTKTAVSKLASIGVLENDTAQQLIAALELWQSLQCMLRLTIEGYFNKAREKEISQGLQAALVKTTGDKDFKTLFARMETTAQTVSQIYQTHIAEPAALLTKDDQ